MFLQVRSRPTVLGAAIAIALTAGACQSSSPPPGTSPSAAPPTIKASYLSQFKAEVLADSAGLALYIFQPDHRQRATCKDSCAAIWPPVFVSPNQRATANKMCSLRFSGPIPTRATDP